MVGTMGARDVGATPSCLAPGRSRDAGADFWEALNERARWERVREAIGDVAIRDGWDGWVSGDEIADCICTTLNRLEKGGPK